MAKAGSKLKRDGKGYILTITSASGTETRIKIQPNGTMRDMSGRAILQSDVTSAVLELRVIGNSGMIENILKWWDSK